MHIFFRNELTIVEEFEHLKYKIKFHQKREKEDIHLNLVYYTVTTKQKLYSVKSFYERLRIRIPIVEFRHRQYFSLNIWLDILVNKKIITSLLNEYT